MFSVALLALKGKKIIVICIYVLLALLALMVQRNAGVIKAQW